MDYHVTLRKAFSVVRDWSCTSLLPTVFSAMQTRVAHLPPLLQPKEIRGATVFREVRAGLTTFATMAYIIAVNVSGNRPRCGDGV
jgi:AGZA family xanthine/uracil permease-like MFS transporter